MFALLPSGGKLLPYHCPLNTRAPVALQVVLAYQDLNGAEPP